MKRRPLLTGRVAIGPWVKAALLAACCTGAVACKGGGAEAPPTPKVEQTLPAPTVSVTLSPRALAELTQREEKITVAASWYGDPRPEAQGLVDESGRLAPGRREWQLPPQGGSVELLPEKSTLKAFEGIAGPVGINVNVYSSRLSGPDNVLSCDFIDGDIAEVAVTPRVLSCGLIEEGSPTRAFP